MVRNSACGREGVTKATAGLDRSTVKRTIVRGNCVRHRIVIGPGHRGARSYSRAIWLEREVRDRYALFAHGRRSRWCIRIDLLIGVHHWLADVHRGLIHVYANRECWLIVILIYGWRLLATARYSQGKDN